MKYLYYILYIFLASLISGCVSSGAYKAALKSSEKYYDLSDRLRKDSTQLANSNQVYKELLDRKVDQNIEKDIELIYKEADLKHLQDKLMARQAKLSRLKSSISSALFGFGADELSVYLADGQVHIALAEQLLFSSGSAWVNQRGKQALSDLAQVLQREPDLEITIEGHTDNIPVSGTNYKDNWDLSVSRAMAVTRILVDDFQVNPQRITAAGRSKYDPVASNQNESGRDNNRRTEIIVSPDLNDIFDLP